MGNRDWSEDEIYKAALTEWLSVLAQLWYGIGKQPEPERLKVYRDQLASVPLGLLELSIMRVMREETWAVIPSVGRIWQAIRKECGSPYDLDIALKEWHPSYRSRMEQPILFDQAFELVGGGEA
jgi:hypothetical protein